ncbi:hypothetical protein GO495_29820 [Chitinophaga oryziterrae]|uniref:Uncharacterized protein n=1 Tax=Chitinophaga oryziterrae TaxID=1031224 RepID=A0A6N8JHY6_9BACT|nr:hypothetical protein [Chitinophaga oryziterrae]MVT44827.1 hypothetical protein [Chitinophaga oryziterrae]
MNDISIFELIKKSDSIQEFLVGVSASEYVYAIDSRFDPLSLEDRELIASKMNQLMQSVLKKECVLLLRGEKKTNLERKLISKLNSNDSLYDGLFLVGDKAKNYLEKVSFIPHAIKRITDVGRDVVEWIFEEYSNINDKVIDSEYFRNESNKMDFVSKLENNHELIDYYLFGLHTFNSDLLVNFVSTTTIPKVAIDYNNDLIIIAWLSNKHKHLSVNKNSLVEQCEKIMAFALPPLKDSFHPTENEYAIKGFLPAHYILGAIDVKANLIVFNPEALNLKADWIADGFDINQLSFDKFIKTTNYKRSLMLMNGQQFIEKENMI